MATVIKESPVTMTTLFGKELGGALSASMTELFAPVISRVAERCVLEGKSKEQVFDAVTTTAEAMVVGLRAVVKNASEPSEIQQPVPITLTVQVPPGPQI